VIEHKHCKKCKEVIEKPLLYIGKNYNLNCEFYHIEVCIDCVIKEGIMSYKRKLKKTKKEEK